MITMTPIAAKVVPPSYKQCAFMAAYKSLYNKTLDKLPSFLHSNRQIPNEGLRVHSPIPFEFILIVFASLMSYLLDIHDLYQVEIIGHMNKGFLTTMPQLEIIDDLFVDALAMALLMYVIHCRNATNALKERKLKINNQQELATLITIGSFSSFFGALPVGSSMSRNRLAIQAGATSLLVNIIVVVILVPTILWVTIFFIPLPVSILTCVVLSSLGETFMDLIKLPIIWNTSRLDVISWAFSCSITLFSSNSSYALFVSMLFAAFTVIVRIQCPKFQYLVNVTGSGAYYAERDCYGSDLLDESGVAVVRFEAPLLFNNVAQFKKQIIAAAESIKGQLMTVGIGTRTGSMKSANAASIAGVKDVPMRSTLLISGDIVPNYEALNSEISWHKVIIIDFSSVPIVDAAGLDAMKQLFVDFSENKTKLLFASVNAEIRNNFKIYDGFEVVAKSNFFPSVHDAVLFSQQLGGMIAPSIHMSVSMNGCRDLITLSTATSNHDLDPTNKSSLAAVSEATSTSTTTVILHGRPSLPATMATTDSPPPSPNMLRATASSMSR
uniref:STAS domain-containing protein n=1 Tax=Acrobeloides nanus TaxID=290746 RepID=A0A914ECJ1_9BILA